MDFIQNRAPPNNHEIQFYNFLLENYREQLIQILGQLDPIPHYSLEVPLFPISHYCPKICAKLFEDPEAVISIMNRAAHRALGELYEALQDKTEYVMKRHLHVRIFSLTDESVKTAFPGSKEVGKFMGLDGTVVRTSSPTLLEYKKFYRCSKCKAILTVEAVASRCHAFPRVDNCENQCVGAKVEPFETGDGSSNNTATYACVKDYQEIKLQEPISSRKGFGNVSKAITVILENDLVDSCKPGDDVVITGTLFLQWKPFRKDQPIGAVLTFMANHVEVKNDQRASVQIGKDTIKTFDNFWSQYENNPFEGRNAILRSICPQVYGMYFVKLALCVVMAGGVPKISGAARTRGESHLLLVGDPGTGKSQILKYASKITPRSVFTTGAGTTNAGLTVAAVKDNGEWHLEAGALVLADSGVCCIDEFSHIKEHDRTSIHEAMEQQSISIAKAGMVSKLGTKCTVIAATNPKLSRFDPTESLELNIGLASPLLSRFDLIIVLKDAQNESWDEFLSDFILKDIDIFDHHAQNALKAGLIWNTELVQSYLVQIKQKTPEMTEAAHKVLSRYFQLQRNSEQRNAARTTVRLLESLYRLAEGHARVMYRDFVLLHDAITAVSLVEASMQTAALGPTTNTLHISFPEDALEEYQNQAKLILQTLNLPELWATEKIYIENFRKRNPKNSMPPPPPPSSRQSSLPRHDPNQSFHYYREPSKNKFGSTRTDGNSNDQNVNPISHINSLGNNPTQRPPTGVFLSQQNPQDVCINPFGSSEEVAFTSTQNSTKNAHAKSFHLNFNDEENAAADTEVLSPIQISQTDSDVQKMKFGNLLQTPSQKIAKLQNFSSSRQNNGAKRKRDLVEEQNCDEVMKNTWVPPQPTESSSPTKSSDGKSSDCNKERSASSVAANNLQRFNRIANSQD